MRVFLHPHHAQQESLGAFFVSTHGTATHKIDLHDDVTLVALQADKTKPSATKSALHRTRLRVLNHKNFSVLFSYKPDRQRAPLLAALWKTKTEKSEKNFSIFQLKGSVDDLSEYVTVR